MDNPKGLYTVAVYYRSKTNPDQDFLYLGATVAHSDEEAQGIIRGQAELSLQFAGPSDMEWRKTKLLRISNKMIEQATMEVLGENIKPLQDLGDAD